MQSARLAGIKPAGICHVAHVLATLIAVHGSHVATCRPSHNAPTENGNILSLHLLPTQIRTTTTMIITSTVPAPEESNLP